MLRFDGCERKDQQANAKQFCAQKLNVDFSLQNESKSTLIAASIFQSLRTATEFR